MGGGGGIGVSSADSLEQAGLKVPPLPPDIRKELKKIVPGVWPMFNNPIDFSILGPAPGVYEICRMMASHKLYDMLIGNLGPEWALDVREGAEWIKFSMKTFREVRELTGKPMAIAISFSDSPEAWRWEAVMKAQEMGVEAGLPVFLNISRTANAVGKYIAYHQRRRELFGR
jgi:acyl-CoA synthetase (NDP forming)